MAYSPSDELDFRRDVDPNMLYELVSLLGEGSYGAVYSARSRDSSKPGDVAIKIIPDADDDLTALWREIKFLQVLRSPFVVSFIESLLYDNELWLVMELCDGGSLFDLKEAVASFTEPELQAVMAFRYICATITFWCSTVTIIVVVPHSTIGLAHLHSQRSIHRVSGLPL
jgi:serine/threonine protein kinase